MDPRAAFLLAFRMDQLGGGDRVTVRPCVKYPARTGFCGPGVLCRDLGSGFDRLHDSGADPEDRFRDSWIDGVDRCVVRTHGYVVEVRSVMTL